MIDLRQAGYIAPPMQVRVPVSHGVPARHHIIVIMVVVSINNSNHSNNSNIRKGLPGLTPTPNSGREMSTGSHLVMNPNKQKPINP